MRGERCSDVVELRSLGAACVVLWSELQSEPIAAKTGEDVQMYMKYFLHGSLAIREEEIHTFTRKSTSAEGRRGFVTDAHNVSGGIRIKVGKVGGMPHWDHQEMTEINRLDIHERGAAVVAIDETRRESTVQDTAENALAHRRSRAIQQVRVAI